MGISTNAYLVYGLSFDDGEIEAEALADHIGYEFPEGDDSMYDLEKPLQKLGLEVTSHCSSNYPMHIIGCGGRLYRNQSSCRTGQRQDGTRHVGADQGVPGGHEDFGFSGIHHFGDEFGWDDIGHSGLPES